MHPRSHKKNHEGYFRGPLYVFARLRAPSSVFVCLRGFVLAHGVSVYGKASKGQRHRRRESKHLPVVKAIDQERHGWYMPIQGTPIPKIKLRLYNGEEYNGTFGIGEDFFWTNRSGGFDGKPATDEELQTFLNTVGVDKKRLYRGFGELDPQLPPPESDFPPKKDGK